MAVLPNTFCLEWHGSIGVTTFTGGERYRARWKVHTDNPLDQKQVVETWFRANIVDLGDTYIYANDNAGSSAVAISIAVFKAGDASQLVWLIEVEYECPQDPAWYDDSGDANPNPLTWQPKITLRSNQYSKPGYEMVYEGGYQVAASDRIGGVGTKTVPVNSAMQPFDPLPELDQSRLVISVVGNVADYNADLNYCDFLNDQDFTINHMGFFKTVPKFSAKIHSVQGIPKQLSCERFIELTYVIEFMPELETWVHLLPDIGTNMSACDGDPTMDGRTYGQLGADMQTGKPKMKRGTDSEGEPINGDSLLDGRGRALNTCDPWSVVLGQWRGYEQIDYSTLPVLSRIIGPPAVV